jgi:predicted kinase
MFFPIDFIASIQDWREGSRQKARLDARVRGFETLRCHFPPSPSALGAYHVIRDGGSYDAYLALAAADLEQKQEQHPLRWMLA